MTVTKGRVGIGGHRNVDVPIKTLKSIWKQSKMEENN